MHINVYLVHMHKLASGFSKAKKGINTSGVESAAGADMMHSKKLDSALRSLDGRGVSTRCEG